MLNQINSLNFYLASNETEAMRILMELMRITAKKGAIVANEQILTGNRSNIQKDIHLKIRFKRNTTFVNKYTKI